MTLRLERMGFKVERVVDSPTSLALQRWVDGGKLKPSLDAWLRKQPEFDPAEPFPVTDFIAGEKKESLRKRALADATLKPTFATCS